MFDLNGSRHASPAAPRSAIVTLVLSLATLAACGPIPGTNLEGGAAPSFTVPAGPLERRPAELPEGVDGRPADFGATDDLLLGEVELPSGRLVVGEILFDSEPLDVVAAPGSYAAHATLARSPGDEIDSVALLSIVLSDTPTIRWQLGGAFAVDGGTATITSVETRDHLNELFDASEADWLALHGAMFQAVEAQDYLATQVSLAPGRDLALSTSGTGDGVYSAWVGFDAAGAPTRVVLDFLLLSFDWPDE